MKKICSSLALILAIAAMVFVTQNAFAGGGSASSGKPTLSVMWMTNIQPNTLAHEEGFAKKYPQYGFNMVRYPSEDLKTQTRLAFQSGAAPDVSQTNAGSDFMEYVDNGFVLDITDEYFKRGWDKRTYPEFQQANSKNGRVYGISFAGMHLWQTVYYNKTKLDAAGIKIPNKITIEDFVKVAAQVKASGMQPIAFGDKDGWPAILMIGDYLLQASDPSLIDRLNNGQAHWDTASETRAAVDAMVRLAQGGGFVPGWESQDHTAAIQSFVGGVSAMLYMGTWWSGNVEGGLEALTFELGSFSLPLINSSSSIKGTQFWSDSTIFINSKTKNVQAAYDFVDYLVSEDYARAQMKDSGTFTFNPTVNQHLDLAPIFMTEPLTMQASLPKMGYMDHAVPVPTIEVIKVELQKAMTGAESVDQALKNIEASHAAERTRR
ncbi:ABC transporter substrate-binding protein [Leadbettera azotonutricia]|uniref:Putative bacterial extracellular solute-binding protein n=1 Tax=Leadbettera azotonutricia (strain ATCC BAA-888 / DSM 13862 / ZAS-9) TaxID=545695 RepID=F5YBW6_LEAAZ|nr:extracellular solute-binding protein [Leadbettera azotonutricia]AEF80199.1 putative bacterial extracellular solute-binding protein [Leadbettera azotonutricia ZAS-9]